MKRILFLVLFACATARTETIDDLIKEASSGNPELAFYEKQIAALPKPSAGSADIPQPLDFPGREQFRAAVLNLDGALARLYLQQFRFVLAGEVRLKAIEYAAESEAAACAAELAKRTSALVRMLEERPAAGSQGLVERRILEGAALPFIGEAARARAEVDRLRIELNGLLGRRPGTALTIEKAFSLPPPDAHASVGNLMTDLRAAEIDRGLAGLEPAANLESYSATPWFATEDVNDTLTGYTRPSATGGLTTPERRQRLLEDARDKITRELERRSAVSIAAREVAIAIPEQLVQNLIAAAQLADRQYRVGALPVSLVLEANREALSALQTRNEAYLRVWRGHLDLELISLSTKSPK